ncbi:MAG TPA: YidC/Oxa1 family membrane protein insertase [Peptococcaceae bacterium]|nr:YidC/Oxa1 family membrane protein insertase [Peptococcaceae bacterium]
MTTFLVWLFNLSSMIGLPYYGVAIIIFTILIKILTYPLTWKQMTSMRKMTALQPKMQELQRKYGHDKAKLNQKIMELYSKEKVNPYAGCLPILVQLPILWAFYRTLYEMPKTLGLQGNEPSVQFLGFNITQTYGFALDYHLLLPILAGVTTYLMSKVSMATSPKTGSVPSSAEKTQKMMLLFMPFFLAYIVASLPSGLGIYILTMNIVSIFQTIYINKKIAAEMAGAKAAEADIKPAAAKAQKGEKEKSAKDTKAKAKDKEEKTKVKEEKTKKSKENKSKSTADEKNKKIEHQVKGRKIVARKKVSRAELKKGK